MVGLVIASPDLQLREIVDKVQEITGVSVDISTICRLLAQHGLTRKKLQHVALQRIMELRSSFRPVFTPFQLRCSCGLMNPDLILRISSGDMAMLCEVKGQSVENC